MKPPAPKWRRYLRLFGPDAQADVDDELQFHIEAKIEDLRKQGYSPAAAKLEALRQFGNMRSVRSECERWGRERQRQIQRGEYWSGWAQDLRYVCRSLRKSPGFTAVTLFTLALGIGVNVAIFSLVYGILLRPLPYPDSNRLMVAPISLPDFDDLRQSTRSFDDLAVWASNQYPVTGDGLPEQVLGATVSDRFFPLAGQPLLGRTFTAAEMYQPLVVISHEFWKRRYNGDASAIGRSLRLGGQVYTVIGVMPPEFQLPSSKFQLWTSIELAKQATPAQIQNRALRIFRALGHLRPGVSEQQARQEMQAFSQRQQRAYADTNSQFTLSFTPLRERLVGEVRPALLILMGTASLVLLIACANVANLLLARGAVRTRELVVRAALGAGRGRLIRQLLTESLVLSVAGGLLGIALAYSVKLLPIADLPQANSIRVDPPVLCFALLVSIVTAVLFGLAPALQTLRSDLQTGLREAARGLAETHSRRRFRAVLITAEMSLALVVLIGAGLLVKSLIHLTNVDAGFVPQDVLTTMVQLVHYREPAQRAQAAQRIVERLRQLPGVLEVGGSTGLPPVTAQRGTRFAIQGLPLTQGSDSAYFIAAMPDYFRALRSPVVEGRTFTERDSANAQKVVLINDRLARTLFPKGGAVGQHLRLISPEESGEWRTIVGVVRTIRYSGLDDPSEAAIYTPFAQTPFVWLYVMLRHDPQAGGLAPAVARAVSEVDGNLTAVATQPLETVVYESSSQPRFRTMLLTGFAALALTLAAVGIYGVIAYSVAQRTREFGVRLALGASRQDVLRIVLSDALHISVIALVLGLPSAWAASRLLRSILYEVQPSDPVVMGAVSALLLGVALLASYIPARRATRVDPLVALRHD